MSRAVGGSRGVFARYVVVGTFVTLIDFAVTLAAALAMHYLVANTLGFVVANAVQFVANHRWVFGRKLVASELPRLYLLTFGISVFALAASNAIVYAGVAVLGIHLVYAKVLSAPFVLALNFGMRRAFAYR